MILRSHKYESQTIKTLLSKKIKNSQVFCNDRSPNGLGKSNHVVIQCEVTSGTTTVCRNVGNTYKISGGSGFYRLITR